MPMSAYFWPTLLTLKSLQSRALRKRVWSKISPAARSLVNAAILYLRKSGRTESPAHVEALRKVKEGNLKLTIPLRHLGKAVELAKVRTTWVEVDNEKAVALGIQWLNMPRSRRIVETTLGAAVTP
ncbi:MAG: hypothetical protein ACPL3C_09380 [Pyrobaculum sp.]